MTVKIEMGDRVYQGVQHESVLEAGETYEVDDELAAFLIEGDFGTEVKASRRKSTASSTEKAGASEEKNKADE